jgi:hypothetical protein
VPLTEDSENRVVEVSPRIANDRGTEQTCELRLQLLPGLSTEDLDGCLDPLLRHCLPLVSRSSEVSDWIAVEPLVAHNERATGYANTDEVWISPHPSEEHACGRCFCSAI